MESRIFHVHLKIEAHKAADFLPEQFKSIMLFSWPRGELCYCILVALMYVSVCEKLLIQDKAFKLVLQLAKGSISVFSGYVLCSGSIARNSI